MDIGTSPKRGDYGLVKMLFVALVLSVLTASQAFSIEDVTIFHDGQSRADAPWAFCGSSTERKQFTAEATFIDKDGNDTNSSFVDVKWTVELTGGNARLYRNGEYEGNKIETEPGQLDSVGFSIAPPEGQDTYDAGEITLTATVRNCEECDDEVDDDGCCLDPDDKGSDSDTIHLIDLTFDSLENPICPASTDHAAGTSLATASITPSEGRDLKWELMDNDIDATIDAHGTTAIITAGSEAGKVTARVCDSVLTSCTAVTKQLAVVKISLIMNNYQLSASSPWDEHGADDVRAIEVQTDPSGYEWCVDLWISGSDPERTDKGTLKLLTSTPWPTVYQYEAFQETKSNSSVSTVTVTISAGLDSDESRAEKDFWVYPVFRYLTTVENTIESHSTALEYAIWKYDISTSNCNSIQYNEEEDDMGEASALGNVDIGPGALNEGENVTASVVGHENVHAGQSPWLEYWKGEFEAYQWEMNHADETGIPDDYLDDCRCRCKWALYLAGERNSKPPCDRPPGW